SLWPTSSGGSATARSVTPSATSGVWPAGGRTCRLPRSSAGPTRSSVASGPERPERRCGMSMVQAVAVLVPWLVSAGATPDAGRTDPLAVASRLLGRWVADADQQSPGVTGWSTFEREAQGRVIVRKNHAEYPAANDRPASSHDDLMVIYTEW